VEGRGGHSLLVSSLGTELVAACHKGGSRLRHLLCCAVQVALLSGVVTLRGVCHRVSHILDVLRAALAVSVFVCRAWPTDKGWLAPGFDL
jgi:hypothetical protein